MPKTLTTVALVLALCCTAFAGEIHTPGSPQPAPTPTSTAQEPADTDEESGATEALTQLALDLLAALPSLL